MPPPKPPVVTPPAPPPRACGGKKLRVTFYDVGQALSALVELPDGRRILVDTGEQPNRAGCGAPCKAWSNHLLTALERDVADKRLDAIWTTHQHSDHAGNADSILSTFTVGTYVDNGTNLDDDDKASDPGPVLRARRAAEARGTKIVVVDPEHMASPIAGGEDLQVRPLVPRKWPVRCDKHPNDCSIGLRVNYCESSLVFTGDAETKEEASWPAEPATVLQAGHHGSDTSSSNAFANAVHPRWVVISSGKRDEGTNRTYCHPRRSTVERLGALADSTTRRPMEVFQGTDCRTPGPKDWTMLEVSDHVLSTARDGDVSLVTTGDGEFTRE